MCRGSVTEAAAAASTLSASSVDSAIVAWALVSPGLEAETTISVAAEAARSDGSSTSVGPCRTPQTTASQSGMDPAAFIAAAKAFIAAVQFVVVRTAAASASMWRRRDRTQLGEAEFSVTRTTPRTMPW